MEPLHFVVRKGYFCYFTPRGDVGVIFQTERAPPIIVMNVGGGMLNHA